MYVQEPDDDHFDDFIRGGDSGAALQSPHPQMMMVNPPGYPMTWGPWPPQMPTNHPHAFGAATKQKPPHRGYSTPVPSTALALIPHTGTPNPSNASGLMRKFTDSARALKAIGGQDTHARSPSQERGPMMLHQGNFSMRLFDGQHKANGNNHRQVDPSTRSFVDNRHYEMSPIQCKSMLTCNDEFRQTFPYVYYALVKEVVDIRSLAEEEMIIPFKQELKLKKQLKYQEKAVVTHLAGQLQRGLSGRFPCIDLGKRLVDKVANHLWEEIVEALGETERDRTIVQTVTRQNITSDVKVNNKFSTSLGVNAVVIVVEGTLATELQRGYLYDMVNHRQVYLNVDIVAKCIFLNGGQLAVLDRDALFQDQVEIGENRNIDKVVSRRR